jgi:hypothetical protein
MMNKSIKNNQEIKENSAKTTDNQIVKKDKEIKGNVPLIVKIEKYIFDKYDLRLNTVSNELDGKLKGQKEYELFNLALLQQSHWFDYQLFTYIFICKRLC